MFTLTKPGIHAALDERDANLRDQLAARTFGDRPLVPQMPLPSLPVNRSYDPTMREIRKAQLSFVAKPHDALSTAHGLAHGEYHEYVRRMSFQLPAPLSVNDHMRAQDQRTTRNSIIRPVSPIRLQQPRLERYLSQPRGPAK